MDGLIIIMKKAIVLQIQGVVKKKENLKKANLCWLEPQEGVRLDEKHGEVAKGGEVVHRLPHDAVAAGQGGSLPHRPLLLPLLLPLPPEPLPSSWPPRPPWLPGTLSPG